MKKKKIINKISTVIYSIMLLITTITIAIVTKLQILPSKYLIPILLVYTLLMLFMGIMLTNIKIKKSIKVFFDFIAIIFIIIFSVGLYYLNSTLKFMDKIVSNDFQTEEYYVLVLKDSRYVELNDLKNEKIGTYKTDKEEYKNIIKDIKPNYNLVSKEYEDYLKTGKALLSKEVDSILINSTYKSLLDDVLSEFKDNIKIVKKIQVKVKNEVKISEADVTNESFNIYISGIDIYGDISLVSRSDVNMIVTINPKTNKVLLTSIVRDYYVQLHGTKGLKDKLTHSGLYGINNSIETIEDLLKININYYVRVNFNTLIKLVDSINGITIYSDRAFRAHTNSACRFSKGNNNVYGKCALAFSRERLAYPEGDGHRVLNQQAVLTAIIQKSLSSKTLTTKYTAILKSLGNSFETNMPQNKIYDLINMQLDKMPSWKIENYSLEGTPTHRFTHFYDVEKLYVVIPDPKSVDKAKSLINNVRMG